MASTFGIRRRKPVQEVVQEFDAFPKVPENVQEEKTASGGAVSVLSFILIIWLVYGEITFWYDADDEYRFLIDKNFNESLELHVDLVIAMPCALMGADIVDTADHSLALDPAKAKLQMTPTKFHLNPKEEQYWSILKHKQQFMSQPGQNFKSLDQLDYLTDQVVRGLQRETQRKVKEVERERNEPKKLMGGAGDFISGGIRIISSDGGVLEFFSSHGANDGTACRVHGSIPVAKVAGNLHITPGKTLPLAGGAHAHVNLFGSQEDYNFSHRIERFQFGPRISGLITPLQGTEKISYNNMDLYQYFLKIVPTKVHSFGSELLSYQYSVTQMKREINHASGSHGMPGMNFKYDMSSFMIEVTHRRPSLWQLAVRLCAIVGGIFATSVIINGLVRAGMEFLGPTVNYENLHNERQQHENQVNSTVSNGPTMGRTFVT